jgi:uncharacterized 2Fe-2S/4Fe-4S cluster protein (DUF4445 family)
MTAPLHTVTFEPSGSRVVVTAGTTLWEAASLARVGLDTACGGLGTCGRCWVVAVGGLEPPAQDEAVLIPAARLAKGVRLACRARVAGDVAATVRRDRKRAVRVVEESDVGGPVAEAPEHRGVTGSGALLGAAVDIGTTTVVAAIFDLRSGEQVGSASSLNPQLRFGGDVLSRISHAASHGIESLREPIVRTVEDLVLEALVAGDGSAVGVRELAICGNTTMVQLFLGIDPGPLGVAPYEPAFTAAVERPARDVGLARVPNARLYILPGVSAFVGSDVTAGLLATRLDEAAGPSLLIDLGTNGEIVLRTPGALLAASTAAGPALEGASISCGMLAETGAIESVGTDGEGLRLETIGGVAPRGLCGSGLLDLIAVLLDAGVLDATGLLRPDASHALAGRVHEIDGVRAFEVAPNVHLTQLDVRQVQLAKAAVASGLALLLEAASVETADVTEVFVAGGFGYHVRPEAVVRMGMVPPEWLTRLRFAGNTARAGAAIALLDSAARRRAEAIAAHVTTIDLAARPEFSARFVDAMDFPAAT